MIIPISDGQWVRHRVGFPRLDENERSVAVGKDGHKVSIRIQGCTRPNDTDIPGQMPVIEIDMEWPVPKVRVWDSPSSNKPREISIVPDERLEAKRLKRVELERADEEKRIAIEEARQSGDTEKFHRLVDEYFAKESFVPQEDDNGNG